MSLLSGGMAVFLPAWILFGCDACRTPFGEIGLVGTPVGLFLGTIIGWGLFRRRPLLAILISGVLPAVPYLILQNDLIGHG
jgi:hypothetical protein